MAAARDSATSDLPERVPPRTRVIAPEASLRCRDQGTRQCRRRAVRHRYAWRLSKLIRGAWQTRRAMPLDVPTVSYAVPDGGKARRYAIDDLPAGPLRERLAPIVEVRALLPLAQVRVDARSLRVLNPDDKTVVRLTLATTAALDTGGEPVPLTPRVDVTGVLGYPGPHTRVVTVLGREAGLVDSTASLADEAIAALGGDPEGLRTKVRVQLRPRDRTDVAAVAVLTDLAGVVEANLPG